MSQNNDARWTIITSAVGGGIQLLQMMVAARYLDAHDFGVLSIVNVAIWIVLAFQDLGLSSYCIHIGEVTSLQHSTLFWISTGMGLASTVIVVIWSPFIAEFYKVEQVQDFLIIVSVNFLIIGISSQFQANLIRTFQAKRLAQIEVFARIFSFSLVMFFLATVKIGALAIVYGVLANSILKLTLLAYFSSPDWRPRFLFDRQLAPQAITYGINQTISQVISQFRAQADQLVLGKVVGPELLGLYSLAKELVSYPMRFIQPLIARLTLPRLAKSQNDSFVLQATFLESIKTTVYWTSLLYSTLSIFAVWIVQILYGTAFISVADLIPLMAILGLLRPLGASAGMLAQATGKTHLELRWNVVAALFSLPFIGSAAILFPSIHSFAIGLSLLQVLLTLASYQYFIKPIISINFFDFIRVWLPPMIFVVSIVIFLQFLRLPAVDDIHFHIHF